MGKFVCIFHYYMITHKHDIYRQVQRGSECDTETWRAGVFTFQVHFQVQVFSALIDWFSPYRVQHNYDLFLHSILVWSIEHLRFELRGGGAISVHNVILRVYHVCMRAGVRACVFVQSFVENIL